MNLTTLFVGLNTRGEDIAYGSKRDYAPVIKWVGNDTLQGAFYNEQHKIIEQQNGLWEFCIDDSEYWEDIQAKKVVGQYEYIFCALRNDEGEWINHTLWTDEEIETYHEFLDLLDTYFEQRGPDEEDF